MSSYNIPPSDEYVKLLLTIFHEKAEENEAKCFIQNPIVVLCAKLLATNIITVVYYCKVATKTVEPEYFWYGDDSYFYDVVVGITKKYSDIEKDEEKIYKRLYTIVWKWFVVKTRLILLKKNKVVKNKYYFEIKRRVIPLFLSDS